MKRFLIIIMCLIELSALLGSHEAAAESKSSILLELNEWLASIAVDQSGLSGSMASIHQSADKNSLSRIQ